MCIFCKIAESDIPAEVEYEDDKVMAFRDIHPIAPVHVLVIPKRHISSTNDLEEKDSSLAGHMLMIAVEVAKKLGIAEQGYKLLLRTGENGGQEVMHIHLHLIGGAPLSEQIRPLG